jgi:SAM-dependent methyltransferase
MKITEAPALIRTPLIEWARPQSWYDLGSGSGTFTMALAQLLVPGSTIYAVDFDQRALEGIPDQRNGVEIRKIVMDLQNASLHLPSLDGVLMANTLHFIQEQQVFLRRLLSVADCFLIVEYERSRPKSGDHILSGGSGVSGETGDSALTIRWHDVLGPRRTIQSIIPKLLNPSFGLRVLLRIVVRNKQKGVRLRAN